MTMVQARPWDPALGTLQLSTLRRLLQQEGMATAWWSEVPGARTPEHAHPFPETHWILSGFLRMRVAGQQFDLGPGDRLDVPAGTKQGAEVLGLAPVVYVTGAPEAAVSSAAT